MAGYSEGGAISAQVKTRELYSLQGLLYKRAYSLGKSFKSFISAFIKLLFGLRRIKPATSLFFVLMPKAIESMFLSKSHWYA